MRMHMRRFTRLTNAFSKNFENHMHMVAIYTVWYNWVRIHKTLKVTPAMAAGLSPILWSMEDVDSALQVAGHSRTPTAAKAALIFCRSSSSV